MALAVSKNTSVLTLFQFGTHCHITMDPPNFSAILSKIFLKLTV